jgi:hypothetical protein
MDSAAAGRNYWAFVVAGRTAIGQNSRLPSASGERSLPAIVLESRFAMPFDLIESKKREYTDKYVVVDASQPELARFRDTVGQVKTVNMSGRALVEFMDYHLNTGWYDIDPAFLRIVDKPAPKAAKPEVKKPAAKAEAKPAVAAKTPAAKAPAAGAQPGKLSVADILATARGGKPAGGGEAASPGLSSPKSAAAKTKSDVATESPKPATAPKTAAVDRSKMSVADMLAAARAGGAPGAAKPPAAPPIGKTQAAAAPARDEAPTENEVAEAPAVAAPAKPTEKIDKSKMSIADMLAWCRQHDAK